MENDKAQSDKAQSDKERVLKNDPTSGGRNGTDNFNDDEVDDYGIDYSAPDAEEQLEARITNKGGRGPNSGDRNPNDEYDDKFEDNK
ncbi:hypothetical protein [Dyadobacter crusticola]|uniref:hypothetical protein n=1 Tax=Dyadobacter crusticola TaxID=292407 RepID=UPI0012FB46CB|nr:hypothetical protein [Dyadobacter crusticola]